MEPKIVDMPAFTVVGMYYRGTNQNNEIPQLWRQFGPRVVEIKHMAKENISYGVMDNFDEASKEFDYLAAVKVDSTADVPDGMLSWEIPEQTYAVFTCTLPTIKETFDIIYSKWLPESGYQLAPAPEFELYDERFNPQAPHSELDLYIPIQ